jgi:hypothetical protein
VAGSSARTISPYLNEGESTVPSGFALFRHHGLDNVSLCLAGGAVAPGTFLTSEYDIIAYR